MTPIELVPVGRARTPYLTVDACPFQPEADGPECTIEVHEPYRAGLLGLEAATHVDVVLWFEQARRDGPLRQTSSMHPEWGEVGAFALRTPHRPNPLGISRVAIVRVEATGVVVRGLDCLDGTPVVDLKRA